MNTVSVCGLDCSTCYCASMCKSCNECKGIVFHTDGRECAIYHCCVTEHGYANCLACPSAPCEIWNKTRDPKLSDEEFKANIAGRLELLRRSL